MQTKRPIISDLPSPELPFDRYGIQGFRAAVQRLADANSDPIAARTLNSDLELLAQTDADLDEFQKSLETAWQTVTDSIGSADKRVFKLDSVGLYAEAIRKSVAESSSLCAFLECTVGRMAEKNPRSPSAVRTVEVLRRLAARFDAVCRLGKEVALLVRKHDSLIATTAEDAVGGLGGDERVREEVDISVPNEKKLEALKQFGLWVCTDWEHSDDESVQDLLYLNAVLFIESVNHHDPLHCLNFRFEALEYSEAFLRRRVLEQKDPVFGRSDAESVYASLLRVGVALDSVRQASAAVSEKERIESLRIDAENNLIAVVRALEQVLRETRSVCTVSADRVLTELGFGGILDETRLSEAAELVRKHFGHLNNSRDIEYQPYWDRFLRAYGPFCEEMETAGFDQLPKPDNRMLEIMREDRSGRDPLTQEENRNRLQLRLMLDFRWVSAIENDKDLVRTMLILISYLQR